MPRQNRRRDDRPDDDGEASLGRGGARRESGADGDWMVCSVTGAATTKSYRCPGCSQEIRPATPHVVAWPEASSGLDRRRHWHTACWRARGRRAPPVMRSRNAPRH